PRVRHGAADRRGGPAVECCPAPGAAGAEPQTPRLAQEEGAKDDVTQGLVFTEYPPQLFLGDGHHSGVGGSFGRHMGNFAGEDALSADEFSGSHRSQGSFDAGGARRGDVDTAAAHDEEITVDTPGFDERRPCRYEPLFTLLNQTVELGGSEDRERRLELALELVGTVDAAHDPNAVGRPDIVATRVPRQVSST